MALSRLMLKREFGCPCPGAPAEWGASDLLGDTELGIKGAERTKSNLQGTIPMSSDIHRDRKLGGAAMDVIEATLSNIEDEFVGTRDNSFAEQEQRLSDTILINPVMSPIDSLVKRVRLEGLLKRATAVLADPSFYDPFYGLAPGSPSLARLDVPPEYMKKCKICK